MGAGPVTMRLLRVARLYAKMLRLAAFVEAPTLAKMGTAWAFHARVPLLIMAACAGSMAALGLCAWWLGHELQRTRQRLLAGAAAPRSVTVRRSRPSMRDAIAAVPHVAPFLPPAQRRARRI
jgi:hypothetical protein